MYALLAPIARTWLFVILIILFVAMFAVMLAFQAQLASTSGTPAPVLPDTHFYYTPEQLISILDSLGTDGRRIYLRLHIVDMFYPFVYGLLFALAIIFFWGIRGGSVKAASLLAFVPVVGILSDLTENISIRLVSALFTTNDALDIAALHPFAAVLAGFSTASKWIFFSLSFLAILVGIIFSTVWRRRRTA